MEERNLRKTRVGVVVSDAMDKTIVVLISGKTKHPIIKKYITRSKKLYVHDENNECNVGDKVEVMETRPISKNKHWRLVRIIDRAK
ncbi:MAG TPA: 30S ribosomal protein S17 [Clostridia bacterium]|jgi:small subunit ribosomal protein S17|nr:30S ribosomal protein S17 [Clostridia bacterium]